VSHSNGFVVEELARSGWSSTSIAPSLARDRPLSQCVPGCKKKMAFVDGSSSSTQKGISIIKLTLSVVHTMDCVDVSSKCKGCASSSQNSTFQCNVALLNSMMGAKTFVSSPLLLGNIIAVAWQQD